MRTRVTVITTLNHNVGDDFVREGILYLLRRKLGDFDLSLIHKHIPITVRPELDWYYSSGISKMLDTLPKGRGLFWSKILDTLPVNRSTDRIFTADLLVQSGAPVYWHNCQENEWYAPLIQKRYLRMNPRPPFLNIGAGTCIGYGEGGESILSTPATVSYMKELFSLASVTTFRDELSQRLHAGLGLHAPVIPCPSIFARVGLKIEPQPAEYVVMNFMDAGGHYSFLGKADPAIWRKTFTSVYREISAREPVIIVCHNEAEVKIVAQLLPDAQTFRGTTATDYLHFLSKAKCYLGNRVHGAFAAASFGRPAFVVGNDSRAEMMTQLGLRSVYVGEATIDGLLTACETMVSEAEEYRLRFAMIQQAAFDGYMTALDSLGQETH